MADGSRTGHIGTTQGRVIEVVRSPFFIHLQDRATPHVSWDFNTDQAGELIDALQKAVKR